MNILVCVKQVSIMTTRRGIDPVTNRLLPGELVYTLNPHDEAAVEEALVIREKHGGTVTVLTLGPARAEEALRWCLAMGADDAIHVVDEDSPEMSPFVVSTVLAEVIRGREYDLILFGKLANGGKVIVSVAQLVPEQPGVIIDLSLGLSDCGFDQEHVSNVAGICYGPGGKQNVHRLQHRTGTAATG